MFMLTHPSETLPLWVIAPFMALLLVAAHEAGVRLRRLVLRRRSADAIAPDEDVVSLHMGAVLGLMALLVGFTFGMSLDRFNMRRTLLSEEARAIDSHYRRLLAVAEPQRTRLTGDLIRYLDAREVFSEAGERDMAKAEARSEGLALRLWLDMLSSVHDHTSPEIQAALGTADAMLKAANARRDALAARVPVTVVRAMLVYALIAAVFMGYGTKAGRRDFAASTVQLVLLALAISLVLDLDRARSGTIQVDQTPLLQTVERIRQFEMQRRAAPSESWLSPRP